MPNYFKFYLTLSIGGHCMNAIAKILVTGLFSLSLTPAWSLDFSIEDAHKTFRSRGTSGAALEKANTAADMYGQLYKEALELGVDDNYLAELKLFQSASSYYYAEHTTDLEKKKTGHRQGWDQALEAVKVLTVNGKPTSPKLPENTRTLARAHYWTGANMGKWGLANGILNSLRQWPELRETMGHIETLGAKDVESYGANRILGWAYFKLPFPLGDKSKSLELLSEAAKKTTDAAFGITNHSTNLLYLAQILIARGDEAQAKELLTKFVAVGKDEATLAKYNDERIPETKEEIEEAKKILEKL
jgi:hypothetical protein